MRAIKAVLILAILTIVVIYAFSLAMQKPVSQPAEEVAVTAVKAQPDAGAPKAAVATAADPGRAKAEQVLKKGLDWLKAQQKENGAWGDEGYPAMTAFGLWAFAESDHPDKAVIGDKAARFVVGFVQDDGGIYKKPTGPRQGGLSTYNTAICMAALFSYDRKTYAQAILGARKFMSLNQLQGDSTESGGFSYDKPGKGPMGRPDLSNTAWALHAMRVTQAAEDQRIDGERVDVDWAAAMKFVEKLQNKDENDPINFGGFGYEEGASRGGISTNKAGAVTLRGYGSMTYAAIESMIFAQLDKKDPRVQSALKWASNHWSVEENPGMGAKGLFYYYNIMSKALSLAGEGAIQGEQGQTIPWKQQMIDKIAEIQRPDGSWVNKDNQFWEGDPVLVTAYTVRALQYIIGE